MEEEEAVVEKGGNSWETSGSMQLTEGARVEDGKKTQKLFPFFFIFFCSVSFGACSVSTQYLKWVCFGACTSRGQLWFLCSQSEQPWGLRCSSVAIDTGVCAGFLSVIVQQGCGLLRACDDKWYSSVCGWELLLCLVRWGGEEGGRRERGCADGPLCSFPVRASCRF